MKTFHNPHHAQHQGREEMFRGRMVPCHEVPARLDYVLAELQRRSQGGLFLPEVGDTDLDAAIARVHDARYTQFLAGAWDEWVAMDPANAQRDALPSVWPLGNKHAFRTDVLPQNFAARLGLFSFDSGSPLMAGTWTAARAGDEASLAFNEAVAITLHGPLDHAALTAALGALVARHESLRSTLSDDGRVLYVNAPSPVPCPLLDWSAAAPAAARRSAASS